MRGTYRPFRGVAYMAFGASRITIARTARASQGSLDRWADEQRAAGWRVDVWEVKPIPEVAHATQAAASRAR